MIHPTKLDSAPNTMSHSFILMSRREISIARIRGARTRTQPRSTWRHSTVLTMPTVDLISTLTLKAAVVHCASGIVASQASVASVYRGSSCIFAGRAPTSIYRGRGPRSYPLHVRRRVFTTRVSFPRAIVIYACTSCSPACAHACAKARAEGRGDFDCSAALGYCERACGCNVANDLYPGCYRA